MQLTPKAIEQCQELGLAGFPGKDQLTIADMSECCGWDKQPYFELVRGEEETGPGMIQQQPCAPQCEQSIWNIQHQVFCAARFLRYLRDSAPPNVKVTLAMLICRYNHGAAHPLCKDNETAKNEDRYTRGVLDCLSHIGEKFEPGEPNVVFPPAKSIRPLPEPDGSIRPL
jgi:hypothetical protein